MPKLTELPIFPRLHLFSFLNAKDALSASSVDKESLEFQNTNLFWLQRVQNDFYCRVPEGINPKAYHAQLRVEVLMLATLFKSASLTADSHFTHRSLLRPVLILNETMDCLELYNGLYNKIVNLYRVYFKYATDFPTLPQVPFTLVAFIANKNLNRKIENFAAKLNKLPIEIKMASGRELIDIYYNFQLPKKLPLDFLLQFATMQLWHKVRNYLSNLKQDELASVLNLLGSKLVTICIRFGKVEELRWLFENVSLKITGDELFRLGEDLMKFARNMHEGIAKILPSSTRNHDDHGVTSEQYQLLKERLQDDPAALALISTFSLNRVHQDVWAAKKERINEYYDKRIHVFHQFINLFLQQGVDPDFRLEDGKTVRDCARVASKEIAGSDQLPKENKPMLIGVLNAIINAQLQNVQELNSQPDNDDQQSRMEYRP